MLGNRIVSCLSNLLSVYAYNTKQEILKFSWAWSEAKEQITFIQQEHAQKMLSGNFFITLFFIFRVFENVLEYKTATFTGCQVGTIPIISIYV